jgi:aspartate-semialdehyde dehydrogenase
MGTDVRVAVAGATGALGAEIIKVLDAASWRPAQLVALARASTTTSHVEYGDSGSPWTISWKTGSTAWMG